ncbi:MAG: DUF5060 domain-containing protein [Bacteroidales bacterium]
MINKPRIITSFIIFLTISVQAQVHRPWEVVTISFESELVSTNPYQDIPVESGDDKLTVTFTGKSGEAKGHVIRLTGFWSGGKEWRVNFAAPAAGKWKYKTASADRGLDGRSGTIDVTGWTTDELESNPTRNGFIVVDQSGKNAGHYFTYTNGVPFLWIGDTWWNWTQRKIHFETYKKLVDDRAGKGFTVGQLFVPGNGWGRGSSALDETYNELDTDHMQHIEEMIAYANSKGITVWVHGWWSREEMNERIGEEKMLRWWRYLVHRLGAYNVIWVLAGEYNMHNNGGFELDFWKRMGEMIDREDPYQRIISLHNTPPFWSGGAEAPQWSTGSVLHDEPWLDYNQSQTGHGKYANEMIPLVIKQEYEREPAKPIVITEPWYEFVEGNPTGMDVRLAAWSAILSGAAGHTYGGGHVWLAHVPESPGGGGPWPLERSFERSTLDYAGAVSMQHLASFFSHVPWWEMEPHPELISDYPQPFCLADPGKVYVVYLRYGGGFKLKMESSGVEYGYYFYNPANGRKYDEKSFMSAEQVSFSCPESYPGVTDYKDWVICIYRK